MTVINRQKFRPEYHFSPKENWMNDPNGIGVLRRRVSFVLSEPSSWNNMGAYVLGPCDQLGFGYMGASASRFDAR